MDLGELHKDYASHILFSNSPVRPFGLILTRIPTFTLHSPAEAHVADKLAGQGSRLTLKSILTRIKAFPLDIPSPSDNNPNSLASFQGILIETSGPNP